MTARGGSETPISTYWRPISRPVSAMTLFMKGFWLVFVFTSLPGKRGKPPGVVHPMGCGSSSGAAGLPHDPSGVVSSVRLRER